MLKIIVKIMLFCTVFVAKAAFAQNLRQANALKPFTTKDFMQPRPDVNLRTGQFPASLPVQQMGIFCRYEWKLESKTRLPLRFRLGSLAYCNWLEQKPLYRGAIPVP